jgi:hypothetical protein
MFQVSNPPGGSSSGALSRLASWVGPDTFYAHLGREGRRIFADELFREFYSTERGRPCVPPSTLAIATVLQMYEGCSDDETVQRCRFDDRWKVALDLEEGTQPFAKSTFQWFRAKLILSEGFEQLFLRLSLAEATRCGVLKSGSKIKLVLDTTPVLGRGAVKDTYNLVADGIKLLCQALATVTGEDVQALASRFDLTRYVDEAVSLKGGAHIDWTNDQERRVFLNVLVADAQRLLLEAGRIRKEADEEQKARILHAEKLLCQLISQDVEPVSATTAKTRKQGTEPETERAQSSPKEGASPSASTKKGLRKKTGTVPEPTPADQSASVRPSAEVDLPVGATDAPAREPATDASSDGEEEEGAPAKGGAANEAPPQPASAADPEMTATATETSNRTEQRLAHESAVTPDSPSPTSPTGADASLMPQPEEISLVPWASGEVQIKQGTARDRMPSAHDPDMRHGRKSASKRFDGHKLAIAAEPGTGLVTQGHVKVTRNGSTSGRMITTGFLRDGVIQSSRATRRASCLRASLSLAGPGSGATNPCPGAIKMG